MIFYIKLENGKAEQVLSGVLVPVEGGEGEEKV
jgi:hypothetical protein